MSDTITAYNEALGKTRIGSKIECPFKRILMTVLLIVHLAQETQKSIFRFEDLQKALPIW